MFWKFYLTACILVPNLNFLFLILRRNAGLPLLDFIVQSSMHNYKLFIAGEKTRSPHSYAADSGWWIRHIKCWINLAISRASSKIYKMLYCEAAQLFILLWITGGSCKNDHRSSRAKRIESTIYDSSFVGCVCFCGIFNDKTLVFCRECVCVVILLRD